MKRLLFALAAVFVAVSGGTTALAAPIGPGPVDRVRTDRHACHPTPPPGWLAFCPGQKVAFPYGDPLHRTFIYVVPPGTIVYQRLPFCVSGATMLERAY